MSLPKCKDFTDYNKYPGEENPTTDAQMQEYMDNQNQLMKAASAMMWQPSSEYDVGDIVVSPAMPANTEAVCVTAGMTDSVLEPSWTTGNNIPDGSCFWKLRYVHYTSFLATEEDAVAGTDTEKIMTPATSKYAIEKLAGLPIGHEWWTANPNIPVGCLPLFGGTFSREAYKDLWEWVQTQGSYLISEAEWQEKATANDGNVAFYSDGDGSTTFRVPAIFCWAKGANNIDEVGGYLADMLGSHTHAPKVTGGNEINARFTMNQDWGTASVARWKVDKGTEVTVMGADVSATDYTTNDITQGTIDYTGGEETRPKTITGMYLVKAFGTVSNVGNQDIADISAGLTSAETRISSAETRLTAAEVDIDAKVSSPFTACATTIGGASTTKPAVVVSSYRSGTEWYRKYSDGWIEQGGYVEGSGYNTVTINLHVAMKTTDYCAISQAVGGGKVTSGYGDASNLTTTTFSSQQHGSHRWYVCGV